MKSLYRGNWDMTRYNHFGKEKYKSIAFSSLKVGDLFRNNLWNNKKRRPNIVCIKAGNNTYAEKRSGVEHTFSNPDDAIVRHHTELVNKY